MAIGSGSGSAIDGQSVWFTTGHSAGSGRSALAAAAVEKVTVLAVAGRANILVVPDLDAGNMLAKQVSQPDTGRFD